MKYSTSKFRAHFNTWKNDQILFEIMLKESYYAVFILFYIATSRNPMDLALASHVIYVKEMLQQCFFTGKVIIWSKAVYVKEILTWVIRLLLFIGIQVL